MRSATALELAEEAGLALRLTRSYDDFGDFLGALGTLWELLARPGVIERVMDEVAVDEARDGVVFVELGVMEGFLVRSCGSVDAALDRLTAAAAAATRRHGVEIGIMPTIDRTGPTETGLEVARAAVAYADRGVTALGLASEERGHPAERFAEAFRVAREGGVPAAPHAGELVGPESIRDSLTWLRPRRILHGIRALEDAALVGELVDGGVCLDVCPTSNVILSVVPDMSGHPLPALLAAGVRCTINADDPTLFGPGVAAEYGVARTALGLSDAVLADCARTSVEFSAASAPVKAAAHAGIDAWLNGPAT